MLAERARSECARSTRAGESIHIVLHGGVRAERIAGGEIISAGCSKRPSSKAAGESKPEAYPQGYVEDFDAPRTKLVDFFSILIRGGQ